MKNGKFAKRGVATKAMVMILVVMLIVGISVGGTIAWLTAQTSEVTNTFTVGDIAITLVEHAYDPDDTDAKLNDNVKNTNDYPLIPGTTYFKDPVVTVTDTSEDCYLFVKFEKINEPDKYLTYTSTLTTENGWTQGTGTIPGNVWYRVVNKTDKTKSWHLLNEDKVSVNTNIVKTATAGEGTVAMPADTAQPQLKYTAYAAQKDNLTAAEAWAVLNPPTASEGG